MLDLHAIETLFNPGILFFLLGLIAAFLRSNLEIPDSVVKFLSFYLMLSIGFKGGHQLVSLDPVGGWVDHHWYYHPHECAGAAIYFLSVAADR